jgi:hypothetical protein
MTILFKTKSEQIDHFESIIHSFRSIFPTGKMTAKELGQASRRVTDAMGMPNTTIPGTARVDAMFSYAKKHGLPQPSFTPSKAGRRLNTTLSW